MVPAPVPGRQGRAADREDGSARLELLQCAEQEMLSEMPGRIAATVLDTVWGFLPSAVVFAIIFSVLTLFSSQACNPGRTWWRNPGLSTDVCYMIIIPFLAPYLRRSLMAAWRS